jgi:hypothetical protein
MSSELGNGLPPENKFTLEIKDNEFDPTTLINTAYHNRIFSISMSHDYDYKNPTKNEDITIWFFGDYRINNQGQRVKQITQSEYQAFINKLKESVSLSAPDKDGLQRGNFHFEARQTIKVNVLYASSNHKINGHQDLIIDLKYQFSNDMELLVPELRRQATIYHKLYNIDEKSLVDLAIPRPDNLPECLEYPVITLGKSFSRIRQFDDTKFHCSIPKDLLDNAPDYQGGITYGKPHLIWMQYNHGDDLLRVRKSLLAGERPSTLADGISLALIYPQFFKYASICLFGTNLSKNPNSWDFPLFEYRSSLGDDLGHQLSSYLYKLTSVSFATSGG